jgi:predicted signal transduction protein with EAL and GGDEF domain
MSGLGLLADLATDWVKLDMALVRGIDGCPRRRAIVDTVVQLCRRLGVELIVEGVETVGELEVCGCWASLRSGFPVRPTRDGRLPPVPAWLGEGEQAKARKSVSL